MNKFELIEKVNAARSAWLAVIVKKNIAGTEEGVIEERKAWNEYRNAVHEYCESEREPRIPATFRVIMYLLEDILSYIRNLIKKISR